MATPLYDEDLEDINLAEAITNWIAVGGGASGLGAGADFSMQGTNCVDKQVTAANKGQGFDNGAGITPGANEHFWIWVFLATPGVSNTRALEGLVIMMGTDATNYNTFHVEGKDTYGAAGRVGKCYPVRYVLSSSASHPYRTNYGTPPTDPRTFGAKANITAAVKGPNLGVDAIRRGTGAYITAGEIADPATFAGFAAQNDAIANRWGILGVVGGGYELQGRFVVGQTKTGTPTAAYFDDTNAVISLVDAFHALSDFTQIIVDHASTVFNLTNVTIQALGTLNRGKLVFNNAATVSALTGCVFTDIGELTLRAGVAADGCTFRGCDKLNLNGATLDGCIVEGATTADAEAFIVANTLATISNCDFTFSDGHAIEITAPGTYSFVGNTFTGYGAIGTNDAAIFNNSGGLVTINVSGGGSSPTYRNGAGASTTVSASVVLTVTVKDAAGALITNARVYIEKQSDHSVLMNELTVAGVATESYSGSTPVDITVYVRKSTTGSTRYVPLSTTGTVIGTGFSVTVTLQLDTTVTA